MSQLIYQIYFFLHRQQKHRRNCGNPPSLSLQRTVDYISWYFNVPLRKWRILHPLSHCGINCHPRQEKIIVSLTSYPKRIGSVHLVIETLLRQSMKPDAVILWLAESQFDGLESLPKELLRLQNFGLTIRFCGDLRSHKKYFQVMQEHPNDLVILADDDLFYPRDMIRQLMKLHKKWPQDICCSTCQAMVPDTLPSEWQNPSLHQDVAHKHHLQIFTGSGSLFPPGSLDSAAFDAELIQSLAPYADDLWLTYMAHRKGTCITSLNPWRAFPVEIYGSAQGSLWYINGQDGQNDIQWAAIRQYFEGEYNGDSKIYQPHFD